MDWPQMFPGSLVPLTLGPYIVAAWHSSLVSDGPRDIFTIYQGHEESLLAWGELWESMSLMGLIKLRALCLLVKEGVVSDSLHIYWLAQSTGALEHCIV